MKLGKQSVPIKWLIRQNWLDTECRMFINQAKVEQYAEEKKERADFPPPVVFIDPTDELYRVGDGFHRILAAQKNKEKDVVVELRRGTRRDAFLHGIEVNKQQKGLPFSRGDKSKCILLLLQDEETRKWSQTKIAETVGCAQAVVSWTVRKYANVVERPNYVVDRNGIVRSAPQSKSKEEVAKRRTKALELFAKGLPKIEIARQLELPRYSVQCYINGGRTTGELVDCPHCHGSGKLMRKTG